MLSVRALTCGYEHSKPVSNNVRVRDDAMTSRGDFVAETLCQSLEPWPTITGSLHSVPVTSNWSVLFTVHDVSLHFNFVYTFNYKHTLACVTV